MDPSTHASARDALIERLTLGLAADDRIAAAWLGGSLGRGDGDDWSDIDLWLAIEDGAGGVVPREPMRWVERLLGSSTPWSPTAASGPTAASCGCRRTLRTR